MCNRNSPKFTAALVGPLSSVLFTGFLSNVSEKNSKIVHLAKAAQNLIIWLISSPRSAI